MISPTDEKNAITQELTICLAELPQVRLYGWAGLQNHYSRDPTNHQGAIPHQAVRAER